MVQARKLVGGLLLMAGGLGFLVCGLSLIAHWAPEGWHRWSWFAAAAAVGGALALLGRLLTGPFPPDE